MLNLFFWEKPKMVTMKLLGAYLQLHKQESSDFNVCRDILWDLHV